MSYKFTAELPDLLEPLREKIEATLQPYIAIEPEFVSETTWTQSKFGGLPYLPKAVEYPKTPEGDYLFLLAQINFAEVPTLENLPNQGILQFYIASDDLYGMNFENMNRQAGFRVLYFPDVSDRSDDLVTDFSFLPEPDDLPMEKGITARLQFTSKIAPISVGDYQFPVIFKPEFAEGEEESYWEFLEEYEEFFEPGSHQLGGYPYFTQSDPRENIDTEEAYRLLLQIDSTDDDKIMWGDVGIGNFFIKTSALKKLDFTDVLYNWDCG
ncbi:YwqG family protein [Spirulina sp. 06S082]|uniref:YwqG family protein n=1 Tax=Spirulina sp. 06S082 TaxID=3110248 RepID=UPI002B1FF4AF|nr:YwqG family protein [Spirulina sp. 06S082]MEA5468774.1 YwqG family protein [Spirulina sp. 06S082]